MRFVCPLEVRAHVAGVKDHQFNHGEKLLKQMLFRRVWADAKKDAKGTKRVRISSLPFIDVAAPPVKDPLSS